MIQNQSFDVVIDGANVGFTHANRKENLAKGFSLNTANIEAVINALLRYQHNPFLILHKYHIRHLMKNHPDRVAYIDVFYSVLIITVGAQSK